MWSIPRDDDRIVSSPCIGDTLASSSLRPAECGFRVTEAIPVYSVLGPFSGRTTEGDITDGNPRSKQSSILWTFTELITITFYRI